MNASVGIVAIGRNEGARLEACLASVSGQVGAVVYVDSGSTDGSVEMARARGVEVVALDMSKPFTAARARNAGAERLQEVAPDVRYVQFVDGDCAVVEASALRFRPILMTAFSFILGTLPLLTATGAGAVARIALGMAVFAGLTLATMMGVFFTPVLYRMIQGLSELGGKKAGSGAARAAPAAAESSADEKSPPPAD